MKDFMKAIVSSIGVGAASVIGLAGGAWLWAEVLEPKLNEFKDFKETRKAKKES